MRSHQFRHWNYITKGTLLLGLVFLVTGLLRAQLPQKAAPPPLPEFVEAEQALKAVDAVGPRLMKLLADEKRPKEIRLYPLENRHEAAIWLGKLHYHPAIPMLIQYVDTAGPSYDDGPTYPCRDALQMMGDAAVPAIVDAYLKADNQRLELCLYTAIASKSRPAARTYAKGLATENPAPEFQERVKLLLNAIKPDVPR